MVQVLQPWQLFVAILAGWIDEHRQAAIEYLREENRVVTPDTILRRHRQLNVQKWTHQRRSMGRPQTVREIAELAVRMARENCPLGDSSVEIVRLAPRCPNLDACAERFVRSIKDECPSRMIFFGQRSRRKATREYAAHYPGRGITKESTID